MHAELLAGRDEELRGLRATPELHVAEVLAALAEVVPDNRILVQENGLQDMWSYRFPLYSCGADGGSVVPSEQTSLGFGAAAAVGVRLAAPDRPVVAFVGDGAFGMFAVDLPTALAQNAGMLYVVLRNGGYGWLQAQLDQRDATLPGYAFVDPAAVSCGGARAAGPSAGDRRGQGDAGVGRDRGVEAHRGRARGGAERAGTARRRDVRGRGGRRRLPGGRSGGLRMSGMSRAVVTGWGAVTPLGLTVDETWAAMVAGRSGIAALTGVEVGDLPTRFGGEVTGFDPKDHMKARQSRRMDPYAQYAFAAAHRGVGHGEADGRRGERAPGRRAGRQRVRADGVDREARGGAGRAGPGEGEPVRADLRRDRQRGVRDQLRARDHRADAGDQSSACASGADAIGEAARWIRHGVVDMAVAGGAEHILTRLDLATSGNAQALSTRNDDPAAASRPFDEDRDGFVMSAGAGIMVLESEEHALARGAAILAEVAGYASTSDAYHWTAPDPTGRGVRAAMRGALADAGLDPSDVDYVNAHGTSTMYNDQSEVDSTARGARSRARTEIPVSSTKSMTGHLIGAAGAVEAIVCGLAIARRRRAADRSTATSPIDAAMNFVPHARAGARRRVAMSNSFGFGGHNAVLVLRRWEL